MGWAKIQIESDCELVVRRLNQGLFDLDCFSFSFGDSYIYSIRPIFEDYGIKYLNTILLNMFLKTTIGWSMNSSRIGLNFIMVHVDLSERVTLKMLLESFCCRCLEHLFSIYHKYLSLTFSIGQSISSLINIHYT